MSCQSSGSKELLKNEILYSLNIYTVIAKDWVKTKHVFRVNCTYNSDTLSHEYMSWYTQLLPLIGKKGSSQMCLPQGVVSKVVSDN